MGKINQSGVSTHSDVSRLQKRIAAHWLVSSGEKGKDDPSKPLQATQV